MTTRDQPSHPNRARARRETAREGRYAGAVLTRWTWADAPEQYRALARRTLAREMIPIRSVRSLALILEEDSDITLWVCYDLDPSITRTALGDASAFLGLYRIYRPTRAGALATEQV